MRIRSKVPTLHHNVKKFWSTHVPHAFKRIPCVFAIFLPDAASCSVIICMQYLLLYDLVIKIFTVVDHSHNIEPIASLFHDDNTLANAPLLASEQLSCNDRRLPVVQYPPPF